MGWHNVTEIDSIKFECGYCGSLVATNKGYFHNGAFLGEKASIYICPHCASPTFCQGYDLRPAALPGQSVAHLPPDISALYDEARCAVTVGAYTASVLASRKLLMNIAVNHGATAGATFISYIEHLANKGFVPPNGRAWVDHIRKKGNEATHEIQMMSQADAVQLITFTEMLLKFIYEFPAAIPPP